MLCGSEFFCSHVSSLTPLFSIEFDLSEKREKLDLSCYQSDCFTILQRNIKADLHGTTLSHATTLRQACDMS